MKYLKQTLIIIESRAKLKLIFLSALSIIKAFIEVAGFGLLIPILTLVTDSSKLEKLFHYFPFFKKLSEKEIMIILIALFLIIYFIKTVLIIGYNKFSAKYAANLFVNISTRILDQYLSKEYLFFAKHNSAEMIRNISGEASLFAYGVVGNFVGLLSNIILIFSICALLIVYNTHSIYVIFLLSLICYLVVQKNNKLIKLWGKIRQIESEKFLKKLNEIIGSIKEIILYNKSNFYQKESSGHLGQLANSTFYRDTSISISAPIIEFFGILIFFGMFAYLSVVENVQSSEILVLFGIFAVASMRLLPQTIQIVRALQSMKFNLPVINVVYNILKNENLKIKITDNKIDKLESLSFRKLYFKYKASKKNILSNVNFDLKINDVIGIIGPTGSGKTTLINLISGLIKPNKGKILINNSSKLSLKDIRNKIGYVSQSVYLADDLMKYNISLKNKLTKDDEFKIKSLMKELNLNSLSINSKVGERGSRLSGGQIQRTGIARALFRNPKILIMDESTNALDSSTENKIIEYLSTISKNKIIIFCTHKKKLLKNCNKIFEVKNNKLKIIRNK